MRKESFQAFCLKSIEVFKVTEVGLTSHFKGRVQRGKRSLPHFVCDFSSQQLEQRFDLESDRLMLEKVAMTAARKHLDMVAEDGIMKTADAVSLFKAVNQSQDSRKLVKIKEREVADKDKRFDKLLNAALYGGELVPSDDTLIRDAELDDSSTITPKLDETAGG